MSLKTIELQVAIPRTFDAGKIQEQISQKPSLDQMQTAMLNQSEQERNRIRSTPVIATNDTVSIHEQHERAKHSNDEQKKKERNKEQQQLQEAVHPYKGKHIDLSL